ncbi:retrovirus-related pol polyprotein from transposon TNT 1-94 [Tanacetum coccineum]
MATEVPQTLEYRGGQLSAAPLIEVENFTNWKRGSCATSLDFQDSPDDEEDGTQRFSSIKATDQTEYHKCGKKGHFARDCFSETEVKALMALADEERVFVGKKSANNGEWVKISIQKVHTLLEMEDNDDRNPF